MLILDNNKQQHSNHVFAKLGLSSIITEGS